MPPKKDKRKNKNNDDQEFGDQKKLMEKLAKLQAQQQSDEEPSPDKLYAKPKKQIYQFDFSNQRALDLQPQVIKPQRDKYQDFTPQQIQQLKKIKQQAKVDKQVKNQVKNEKKKQRKKQIQTQKAIQQAQKQKQAQQLKKVQQQIQKQKKKQTSPWTIPLGLLLFLILMFVLQYQKQIYQRLSKFKNQDIDYYQILQADQGMPDKELKNKYKKLVLKYHPDRNTDCKNCKQKFDKIMKAWQILGDPQKRKSYDQNSGYISQLKSASTTLTPYNYHYLVEESKHLWLIQVFDSTNQYSRYFAQFWEELVNNYGDIVKFGRVDIWHQSNMNSYLPYKFQVFPSVYFLDQGYSEICNFNFQRPIEGLKKCIEQAHKSTQQKIIKQIPQINNKAKNDKIQVYLDGKLRANIRVKSHNKMFQKYFDFFYIQKQSSTRTVTVIYQDKKHIFNFTQNTKSIFNSYSLFLQSFIIQQVSTCLFLNECDQKKCILILNKTKLQSIKKQLPFSVKQTKQQYPIYLLSDNRQMFEKQIKNMQQHYQNYDIGLYQNGHIDLGYSNQANLLNPQEGEKLDLQCKVLTWKDWIKEYWNIIYNKIKGNQEQNEKSI